MSLYALVLGVINYTDLLVHEFVCLGFGSECDEDGVFSGLKVHRNGRFDWQLDVH